MTNSLKPINILDIPIHPLTMQEAIGYLDERIQAHQITNVVTANAEIIMMGQQDLAYRKLLQEADLVLPDGAGTVWAGRTLGNTVPERVAGFDLFLELIKHAAVKSYKVFFFGSSPGIAEIAKRKVELIAPGVQIVGCRNGYFSEADNPGIIEEINASGAQLLFVALGAPKQEIWLKKYSAMLAPYVRIGIGGSFDVLAGKMSRAPKWMQEASLEWLYRLYKQPSRFIRMLALPHFVLKILYAKYCGIK